MLSDWFNFRFLYEFWLSFHFNYPLLWLMGFNTSFNYFTKFYYWRPGFKQYVTTSHFDIPQALEDEFGVWY